jgi:hypothetical protein
VPSVQKLNGGLVVSIKCEWCQREMVPYHSVGRFCCRQCSDLWFQAERRDAVAYFRAQGMRPTLRKEDAIERTGT